MTAAWERLDKRLSVAACERGASVEEIKRLRQLGRDCGLELPEDYFELLRQATEIEIAVEERGYLRFWSPARVDELNAEHGLQADIPGGLAVGDDEGGKILVYMPGMAGFGLHLSSWARPYPDDAIFVAGTVTELLERGEGIDWIFAEMDLSDAFKAARLASSVWTHDAVAHVLRTLTVGKAVFDWEPPGEQWGRVSDDEGNIACVCARVPLAFVIERADVSRVTESVHWIRCRSFDTHRFSIDKALLEEIFGREVTDAVDYTNLSVNDLWFATIT